MAGLPAFYSYDDFKERQLKSAFKRQQEPADNCWAFL